jgi:hypothetical protein
MCFLRRGEGDAYPLWSSGKRLGDSECYTQSWEPFRFYFADLVISTSKIVWIYTNQSTLSMYTENNASVIVVLTSGTPHKSPPMFSDRPDLASSVTVLVDNSPLGTRYLFAWCEKPPFPRFPLSYPLPTTKKKSFSFCPSYYGLVYCP